MRVTFGAVRTVTLSALAAALMAVPATAVAAAGDGSQQFDGMSVSASVVTETTLETPNDDRWDVSTGAVIETPNDDRWDVGTGTALATPDDDRWD
ncbi:hypothetical protein GCM10014715_45140 [Streptomyces spiralis]|uniref:Uncharacterized protein n=2 Tax=Streptomyces spiralis TaxID=66376 RepID=A0A919A2U1_9ACTN|nr:hypothetical protein GCM10014715_45140 [Streptomyces spiralis]